MRPRVVIVAAAVLLLALGVIYFVRSADDSPNDDAVDAAADRSEDELAEPEDDSPFVWFDDVEPGLVHGDAGAEGFRRGRRRGGWSGDGGTRRGRGRRRARFRNMSEDERQAFRERRRARFPQRVEVVALGPAVPAIAAEDLLEPFHQARGATRDCLREQGENARRSWRHTRAESRELVFDLDAEGRFVPGSFVSTPPLPSMLAGCFEQGLSTVVTERSPGPDGARVSMQMPARRPRDAGSRRPMNESPEQTP